MKADVLIKIIERERNARIDKSNPSSRFIYQAYTNIVAKVQESFGDSENVTTSKINELPISDGMKEKLKKMLTKKIPKSKKSSKKTSKKKSKKSNVKITKKNKESLQLELVKYMGLGKTKAKDLIDQGLTSIEQLQSKPWFNKLPLETRTTLKNTPLRKIPHDNIANLESLLTKTTLCKAVLVGSYRRKTAFSRDIDIMLVSDKHNIINKYLDFLKRKLTKVAVYSLGTDKMSLVFKSPETKGKFYKIDAFQTPKKYEAAMLLYATGSKVFNIRMRAKAKAAGYLLNQNGLHTRKTSKKITIKKERDFFTKLKMNYVAPEKRY